MKRLKKILLIDDDEITCYLTQGFFESMDTAHEVNCVHDGFEVLKHLQQLPEEGYPDLILLDIRMPGMNGFEFLEALDNYEDIKSEKLYIVILTSSSHKIDKDKISSFDIIKGFITKPLNVNQLHELLGSMPAME